MPAAVKHIAEGSPASRTKIAPGDILLSVNGASVTDVLDYRYRAYDARLRLVLRRPDGRFLLVSLRKEEGEEPGIEFDSYLMDSSRSCSNKCVFCFVDQLPRGMRRSLYYKDDDARLSFLQGNYVTLTNMTERELSRLMALRVSPLNVSVHTMNPGLRAYMLGSEAGARGVRDIRRLAEAGISMNCQIVLCPGINDGEELEYSMRELRKLCPSVASVSVVPVGLTRHRGGLPELTPFDAGKSKAAVLQVESFAEKCLAELGSRIFFAADELYIKAGLPLPPDGSYEDYPQLENGVGMMRALITEFETALAATDGADVRGAPFTAVTGRAAEGFINGMLRSAREKFGGLPGEVVGVTNDFFGDSVDVAGLVTGGDIIKTLKARGSRASRLLIPRNMLRRGEDVFLDGVTVRELEERLGVSVRAVAQDGADLLRAMTGDIISPRKNS
ncbi:MAG: DUF512 domain-containing protein [Oscillospiraceae bacterium]|jgi:putative radical SAM enzyme (TIGR03279 family)|nr:DUF512 domain-containing protein [Oscillospiraceae bacterium]